MTNLEKFKDAARVANILLTGTATEPKLIGTFGQDHQTHERPRYKVVIEDESLRHELDKPLIISVRIHKLYDRLLEKDNYLDIQELIITAAKDNIPLVKAMGFKVERVLCAVEEDELSYILKFTVNGPDTRG